MNKYQSELKDWEDVNKQLSLMDLPSVQFVCPSTTEKPDNTVMIKRDVTRRIRENLMELMKKLRDERRSNAKVIADLTSTNEQVWSDMFKHEKACKVYEDQLNDLRDLLEDSKIRVKELEAEVSSCKDVSSRQLERVTNTKDASQSEHQQSELRCLCLESEVEALKAELQKKGDEDTRRSQRQREIFLEFQQKTAKAHSAMDQKLLDVIDSYESEVGRLKRDLDKQRSTAEDSAADVTRGDFDLTYASSNLKELIRSYEKGLRFCHRNVQQLEERNDELERQLLSRPSANKHRELLTHVKKLEGMLKERGVRLPGASRRGPGRKQTNEGEFSLAAEDIEYLPVSLCRKYLKMVCDGLEITTLEDFCSTFEEVKVTINGYPKLEQVAKQVLKIVTGDSVPSGHAEGKTSGKKAKHGGGDGAQPHRLWCDHHWTRVLPVLQSWSKEITNLKDLHRSIAKLQALYLGKDCVTLSEGKVKVKDMMAAVDCLVVDRQPAPVKTSHGQKIVDEKTPSGAILLKMVQHFQHLFDCPSMAGIYPLMNSVYSQLNEQRNVIKAVRGILGLGDAVKGSEIVDAVGRICDCYRMSALEHVRKLLCEDDLEIVVDHLEEHRRFIPLFTRLLDELMEVLELTRVDEVLPAVNALKLLST